MQSDYNYNNFSQKFDILKPMTLAIELKQALAVNFKSFETKNKKD